MPTNGKMSTRERLIAALKVAPDEYGVVKMSTEVRDMIVRELEAGRERLILRTTNWVRMNPQQKEELKKDITAQMENGDRVIILPNIVEPTYIPEGLEIQVEP